MPTRRAPQKPFGFTLIETLVVLSIGLLITAAGTQYVVRHSDNLANETAAQHMAVIAKGAHAYAGANSQAILSTLSTTPTATVSVATLQAQGFVPTAASPKNNFGQDYSIRFVSDGPSSFEGLVFTTGGEHIQPLNKRKIAQLVGAAGGYLDDAVPTQLAGSMGAWRRPTSDFGIAAGQAELSYALFMEQALDTSQPTSNAYLSRSAVAGQPELNQMATTLNMGGNRVDGVAGIELVNGAGRAYAGVDSSGNFTVGDGPDQATSTKWMTAGASGTQIRTPLDVTGPVQIDGNLVWHAGNFDPATKADVAHDHAAASITSGTLDSARIPNLDGSKITTGSVAAARIAALDAGKVTTGTFSVARIPGLDAAQTSTGTFNTARIPALDASKITSGILASALVPALDASKVTTGTFAAGQIPSLDATKITTGVLGTAQIPNLDASKITSGAFDPARIPDLDASKITSGTLNALRIPALDASKITTGVLSADRIPNIDAAKVTTGTLNVARIPSLDASKITTGVFADAQIPALQISKITGLQSALNAKLDSTAYTAADVLAKIKSVDGGGSGLDSDVLDGLDSSFFRNASNLNAGTIPNAQLPARIGTAAAYAPANDWNNAVETGWYMYPGAANAPAYSQAWFIGDVVVHNTDWVTQTLHEFTGDSEGNTATWRRSRNGGTWSAWYRLRLSEAEQRSLWVDRNGSTMYGTLEIINTARPLVMKSGGHGVSYMEWYVNPNNQGERSGWFGFASCYGCTTMTMLNDRSGGNIDLRPGAGGYVYVASDLLVQGNLTVSGEAYFNRWVRTTGSYGIYFAGGGGGWYMTDGTWIRAYNNKNIYTPGEVRGGRVTAEADIYAGTNVNGNTLQVRGVATCNAACSPNGVIAMDSYGHLLSCAGGTWNGGVCGSYAPTYGGCTCPVGYYDAGGYCRQNNGTGTSYCL